MVNDIAARLALGSGEEVIEGLARFKVQQMGEDVDEVATYFSRDWSAHERLTLHQQSEQIRTIRAAIEQEKSV